MSKFNVKNKKHAIKKSIMNNLELPVDIMERVSIVTMYGSKELWVENYKGLLEYTKENIVIQGKDVRIKVFGTDLFVDYYSNEEMKIVGKINNIIYE